MKMGFGLVWVGAFALGQRNGARQYAPIAVANALRKLADFG